MLLYANTLKKQERLKKKQLIDHIYREGYKLFEYPFLMRWEVAALPTKYPAQVLIGVSGKRIKKAVQRNKIKRMMREAYRTNKHIIYPLLDNNDQQMAIAINYIGKKMPQYSDVEQKIIILLQRLADRYEKN
ncbi:MAG: ribonuclease P protein component [Bacteroidales bacterium]|nr:ribonuclease P protein component [Bacteroidales bacterium]MCF8334442.1 ribonuclease P protein component [Bacteroidales bacterium]